MSRQRAPTSIEESSSSALLLRQLVVGEADDGEGAYLTQGRLWLSLGTLEDRGKVRSWITFNMISF